MKIQNNSDELKKIIFVVSNYYPHIGGVEKHVRELSLKLLEDGHKVTVVLDEQAETLKAYERIDGIDIFRIKKPCLFVKGVFLRAYRLIKIIPQIKEADIIHFHDFGTMWGWGFTAYLIVRMMRKSIYITFHGWEGIVPPQKSTILKRKICEKLVDGNICIGHFIEKWYGTKADIVSYGGVHKTKFPQEVQKEAVFVGRLAPDTGIFEYIKAWKKINYIDSTMILKICGDGPLRSKLQEYVYNHKIENVVFLGFVRQPEIHIKRANVVFTTGYLGIWEALSYKKAVVAIYDNPLKKDYLELFPHAADVMWIKNNAAEVVEAVKDILSENKLAKIEDGYKLSLQNSWEKVKRDYYKLWKLI